MPNEPWIGPTINGNKILFGGRRSRNIYAVVDSRDGVVTAIIAVNLISDRRSLGIATRDARHLPPGHLPPKTTVDDIWPWSGFL